MSLYGLDRMCFPSSVAVIGVDQPTGRAIYDNIVAGGFTGKLVAVAEHVRELGGAPVHPDLESAGAGVDLAVVAVPVENVSDWIARCGRSGVGGVVVPARADTPAAVCRALEACAHASGVRLVGPRSWGIVSPWSGLNAGLGRRMPPPGRLAVISQSRAVCASILDLTADRKIGLSLLVGLGDAADVDCADVLDCVANRLRVEAILIHAERIDAMRKFMSAARAVTRVKPVVVLKTSRTDPEAGTAATATGGLIGVDAAYDAAFQRAGIIRADTVEDLFDCGELVGKQPCPRGPNLLVVTNARSPGIMAADYLAAHGITLAGLSDAALHEIRGVPGILAEPQGPVFLSAAAVPAACRTVVEICMKTREVDGLLVLLSPQFLPDPEETARAVAGPVAAHTIPVFAVWMGGRPLESGRRILEAAGIPTFEAPERAVRAFLHLHAYDRGLKLMQEIPPRLPVKLAVNRQRAEKIVDRALACGNSVLDRIDSLELLRAYDLPVLRYGLARSADEAVGLAEATGFPVILSLRASLPAGTGRRAMRCRGLRSPSEVRAAFGRLTGTAPAAHPAPPGAAVVVQPEIVDPELALRIGCRRLASLGPVMVFGYGGLRREIALDQSIGLPPLNRPLARRMIEASRVGGLLRTGGEADGTPLAETFLVGVSHLIADFPQITELEISPLLFAGGQLLAAGASAVLQPADVSPPMHLIVSPYPDQYETRTVTRSGLRVFVRPIRPEDAALLQELWTTLSSRSLYYRFLRDVKELTPDMLVRFTQIDYDREVALVAVETAEAGDRMLGVARLLWKPGSDLAEFAVLVGDPWQGKGVGAKLLSRLCAIGITKGLKSVWGLVLRENRAMLELSRRLGYKTLPGEDQTEVEVKLDLSNVKAEEILAALAEIAGE